MKKCLGPRSVCVSFCEHSPGGSCGAALLILVSGPGRWDTAGRVPLMGRHEPWAEAGGEGESFGRWQHWLLQVPFTVLWLENTGSQGPWATVRPTAWGSHSTLPHTCPCPPALGPEPQAPELLTSTWRFSSPLEKNM